MVSIYDRPRKKPDGNAYHLRRTGKSHGISTVPFEAMPHSGVIPFRPNRFYLGELMFGFR